VRAKNALLVALGQDRSIEGIVEWVREDVTTEDKWSAALAKELFPQKYEQAMLDREDTVDVLIEEGHPY